MVKVRGFNQGTSEGSRKELMRRCALEKDWFGHWRGPPAVRWDWIETHVGPWQRTWINKYKVYRWWI